VNYGMRRVNRRLEKLVMCSSEPSEFEKHTTMTVQKDGRVTIACNKGLWSVDAPNKNEATKEAVHYFLQYWSDGEYADNPQEAALIQLTAIAQRYDMGY